MDTIKIEKGEGGTTTIEIQGVVFTIPELSQILDRAENYEFRPGDVIYIPSEL